MGLWFQKIRIYNVRAELAEDRQLEQQLRTHISNHEQEAKRNIVNDSLLKISKPPPPEIHLFQQGHTFYSFSNSSTNRGPSFPFGKY